MDTNKMRDISREQFEATWADVMRGDEPPPGRKPTRSRIDPERYAGDAAQFAWKWWQRSRAAVVVELPAVTDELLTAAYWNFDARRKGYPPYAAPAGQECGAFKVAIASAIEAQGLKVKP